MLRLYERVGALPRRSARAGRERVDRVGAEAGEAARALGVDAVALYHRSRDLGVPVLPEQGAFPRPGFPPPSVFRRPAGALSLVDARGAAVSLRWGVPGEPLDADASAPLNAAEAIDALLRVLSGGADGEG